MRVRRCIVTTPFTMMVGTTLRHPGAVIHLATSRSPGNAFGGWGGNIRPVEQVLCSRSDLCRWMRQLAERTIAYAYSKKYLQTHRPYEDGRNQLLDVQILARWIASEAIWCLVTP